MYALAHISGFQQIASHYGWFFHPRMIPNGPKNIRDSRDKVKHVKRATGLWHIVTHLAMDQYLLIPFLGGWTSIYQLFWCSPGVQGFDTLPFVTLVWRLWPLPATIASASSAGRRMALLSGAWARAFRHPLSQHKDTLDLGHSWMSRLWNTLPCSIKKSPTQGKPVPSTSTCRIIYVLYIVILCYCFAAVKHRTFWDIPKLPVSLSNTMDLHTAFRHSGPMRGKSFHVG